MHDRTRVRMRSLLQGMLVELATSDEKMGAQTAGALLMRMAEEQEIAWVEAMIQELIGKGVCVCERERECV